MASPLEILLESATSELDSIVQPTYDFSASLCYRTKGEDDRQAGLEKLVEQLYYSITREDYEGVARWTQVLDDWMTLEYSVPRKVRAVLAEIYYNLALTPGMDTSHKKSARTFSDMFCSLINNKQGQRCLKQGKDLTLDWLPLFDRLKFSHLHTETILVNNIGFEALARVARDFFDPTARVAVLETVLPYFDTAHSQAATGAFAVAVLLSPTAPAPETSSDCQPSSLMPTHWHLFARLFRTEAATSALVELFALFAKNHLECAHVSFGAHGIFDEMQSREIYAAISRLTLIEDEENGSSFNGLSLKSSERALYAEHAAVWIVFSLSPLCLGQETSMLSGLEGFIASFGIMFHPNSTVQSQLGFVTELLRHLARSFCWRYNQEQTGQLATPPERRINDELRQKFVRLMRDPVLSGCFSRYSKVREGCLDAAKPLAELEPGLVVPTALQRFYASQDSQVDGDSAGFSISLLVVLCRAIAREKGLRCHLPTLMNLALSGINASRPNLTSASCQFILYSTSDLPPPHLRFAESGTSEGSTKAEDWIQREIETLNDGNSVVDRDYRKQLSDDQEVALLRSAFGGAKDFVLRFLEQVFRFASEAFRNNFGADKNEAREMAERDILDAAEACFMSLSPKMLEEVMLVLSQRILSDPIPKARNIIKSLVDYAVRASPRKGLQIFLPMLVKHIREEIEDRWSKTRPDRYDIFSEDENLCWYTWALRSCLWRGGSELLPYKDELLSLSQFAQDKCGPRAFRFCAMLSRFMLCGWTETYTTRCAVTGANRPGEHSQDSTTLKGVTWHVPSHEEIQAACEVFESETTWLEKEICDLIGRHPSLTGAEAVVAWGRSLTGALGYLEDVVCGIATLFDPSHAGAGGDGETLPNDQANDDGACISLRVKDFQHVLEPSDPLYGKIHERRGTVVLLASKVHGFLLGCKGEYIESLSGLYNLYRTLISDVGNCHAHTSLIDPRQKHIRWAAGSYIDGVAPSHPWALRVTLMDRHHAELQSFGTSLRYMSDLERKMLQDVTEGCSSPYTSVRFAAHQVFWYSTKHLAGPTEFFLPRMLTRLRDLIRSESHREIETALHTLVWGIMWWKRDCPSQIPDLLRLLTQTAVLEVPEVPGIAEQAKEGIKKIGIPDYRGPRVVPTDGIAEAIRPAGDYSTVAREARESQCAIRDAVREQKEELGLQMLRSITESKLCALSLKVLVRLGFEKDSPPPVEYISFLAKNAVAGDSKLRKTCVDQLRRLVGDFLAGIRFGHNFEDFLRTQGTGGREQVLVKPGRDATYTERYLAMFEKVGNGDDGDDGDDGDGVDDDIFVDQSFHGSLVWPSQFHARRRHVKPTNHDPEIALMAVRMGSFFTKEWFEKFLSHVQLEEQPWEGDKAAAEPGIRETNVDLLTHAFQLMEMEATAAKLEDMKDLVGKILGDGSKIGQHIATATLLQSLMQSPTTRAFRKRVLEIVDPLLINILQHNMVNFSATWEAFLCSLARNQDPRRFPGLFRHVASFRPNASDSGTQNMSKIEMLYVLLRELAWRFRHEKDVTSMLLQTKDTISSVDVSSALGATLAQVYMVRFYDSWPDVRTLIAANRAAPSSFGIRPYKPSSDMRDTVQQLLETVSTLRQRTPIPQQDYHSASAAALVFLSRILECNASGALVPLLLPILQELFPMLEANLTEKTNLKKLATSALGMLCRLPFRGDEHWVLWEVVLEKAKSGPLFHRTAAMRMIRVLYLQRLLTSGPEEQKRILQAVCDKIRDTDMKIQTDAAETLKQLLSRSRLGVTEPIIIDLIADCKRALGMPRQPDKVRRVAFRSLGAAVSAYPQLMVSPGWMVDAMVIITQEALAGTGSSRKAAVEAVRGFKEARRTQWDMVKKRLPKQLLLDMQDMPGPSYIA